MVRIFGNAVGWKANAAKLSSVGLWLNASKSESMLEGMLTPLTTVTWVAIVAYQHHPLATLHLKSVCMPKNNFQWWSSQIFCRRLKYGTWYCKHESSLCATICWGSASVPKICAGWCPYGCPCHFAPPSLHPPYLTCPSAEMPRPSLAWSPPPLPQPKARVWSTLVPWFPPRPMQRLGSDPPLVILLQSPWTLEIRVLINPILRPASGKVRVWSTRTVVLYAAGLGLGLIYPCPLPKLGFDQPTPPSQPPYPVFQVKLDIRWP